MMPMTLRFRKLLGPCCALLVACLLAGCAQEATVDFQDDLQKRLIEAAPGDVIEIPAGTHQMTRSLSLTVDGVTIRGAGMEESVLSFAGQVEGAEGILVTANDFVIEDLAIEDSKGDALKVSDGENIVIRNVRTEWTGGPAETNGAYGIYPVLTRNLLVEGCVAIAASDAGIYVGQSQDIVVRNNRAEYNVAGIEIENSINADVYGNLTTNNTGGILVFNMPNLPMLGHSTRVFNNEIVANNTANFAPAGTAVSGVPAGSGVVINANDKVEIFDNDIADNQTANVWISSLYSASLIKGREQADDYDPYPETIYIYDNRFSGGGDQPDREAIETVRLALFGDDGRVPDVVWDGFANPEKIADSGYLGEEYAICVDNGDAVVLNVDTEHDHKNPFAGIDGHACAHEKLPPIELEGIT